MLMMTSPTVWQIDLTAARSEFVAPVGSNAISRGSAGERGQSVCLGISCLHTSPVRDRHRVNLAVDSVGIGPSTGLSWEPNAATE